MNERMTFKCHLDWFGEDESESITANDAKEAAEKYAEHRDSKDAEYPNVRTVLVLVNGHWEKFEVKLEQVPVYHARVCR